MAHGEHPSICAEGVVVLLSEQEKTAPQDETLVNSCVEKKKKRRRERVRVFILKELAELCNCQVLGVDGDLCL
jgi:hypothetical protein